jgi:hypothetical protein
MPTPEARLQFAEAQRILETVHELHAQHQSLVERLREARTVAELGELHAKIEATRRVAEEMTQQYNRTVDEYVAQVRQTLDKGQAVLR